MCLRTGSAIVEELIGAGEDFFGLSLNGVFISSGASGRFVFCPESVFSVVIERMLVRGSFSY